MIAHVCPTSQSEASFSSQVIHVSLPSRDPPPKSAERWMRTPSRSASWSGNRRHSNRSDPPSPELSSRRKRTGCRQRDSVGCALLLDLTCESSRFEVRPVHRRNRNRPPRSRPLLSPCLADLEQQRRPGRKESTHPPRPSGRGRSAQPRPSRQAEASPSDHPRRVVTSVRSPEPCVRAQVPRSTRHLPWSPGCTLDDTRIPLMANRPTQSRRRAHAQGPLSRFAGTQGRSSTSECCRSRVGSPG